MFSVGADKDHSTATVSTGSSGEQGGSDMQGLWTFWTQLPVVQRQGGGQNNGS